MAGALRCPFCGACIEELRDPQSGNVVIYQHPQNGQRCYLDAICKTSIHPNFLSRWNKRVATNPDDALLFHYTLKDGLPVFNADGVGKPASLHFLNECFDYIRNHTN